MAKCRVKANNGRLLVKLEKKNSELEARAETLRQSREEIARSAERLRGLAARLQRDREEERIRIAGALHDGFGSMLTGIEIALTWMRCSLEAKIATRQPLLDKIAEMQAIIHSSADRIRKLCTELRPSILDDLGLVPTLGWQAREFAQRTGIQCELTCETNHIDAAPDRATAIFRIFQEILTNVACHARASAVKAILATNQDSLCLEVEDDGVGIRDEELASGKSLGLVCMQERAAVFGGTIEFSASPGHGTRVLLNIPLSNRPAIQQTCET